MNSKLFHHSNGLCASEKSNWQETELPTIFFPEDPVKQLVLLAGLLAHPSPGLPTPSDRGSGVHFRRNIQVYSSGDCSGFAPDSLIKALPVGGKKATTTRAKVENYFERIRKQLCCPAK